MRPDIIDLLRCPHCGERLSPSRGSLRCATGHSFDIARQGYVNLLPGNAQTSTADRADMVAAREAFLGAGHFAGLRRAITETVVRCHGPSEGDRLHPDCVIEVGAGTAYYLAGVLDRLPRAVGLALDLSKYALRRAARAGDRIGAVACDIWKGLPVRDTSAVVLLDIFSPRNPAEFRRVLRPGGCLVVVTPTQRHLQELVSSLDLVTVDPRKQQRVDESLAGLFAPLESVGHDEGLALGHEEVAALVGMGPSARHLTAHQLAQRLETLPPIVPITLSVTVSVYRPSP